MKTLDNLKQDMSENALQISLDVQNDEDIPIGVSKFGGCPGTVCCTSSLYLWITTEDLAARKFENCWLILQCG